MIVRLNSAEGGALYLTEAPDGGYRLMPHDPGVAEKMAKAEDIMRRYRDMLRMLSQ